MTTKKTTTADTETATETAPAGVRTPPVVGPAPTAGAQPQTVVLSHHLRIDGVDYPPGAQIRVSPDYARRLRVQGYTART